MINFIICEDNEKFNQEYQSIIHRLCISLNLAYHIHSFLDYNEDFFKVMNQTLPSKIYILDIESKSHKGTEIASKIRKNDLKSLIIFITSYYDKYASELLKSRYMFLKYINKEDDYQTILEETIHSVIYDLDKQHILSIRKKDMNYRLEDSDILFIYCENRKTNIVTPHYKIETSKSLKYYFKILPNHFLYSHKACIINMDKILKIDKTNKTIIFKGGKSTSLVSKNYLPKIINCFNNNLS